MTQLEPAPSRDRNWASEFLSWPIGVLVATAVVLTPGHPWSVWAFAPRTMGVGSALRFGVSFTVLCLAAWRVAEALRRLIREMRCAKSRRGWDQELRG
jgi:hypothetical protein